MGSECRGVIEAISTLSSDNDKEICSTISTVEEYLNGLLNNKQHFKRAYVAICTKIFELTCQWPFHRMSWLVYLGPSSDVINTLCTCLATSSMQGSHLIEQLIEECCTCRLKEMLWNEQESDEHTFNNLINMPQLLSNRLQLNLKQFFTPRTFYTTLLTVVCEVLAECHDAISNGTRDCSLSHIGHLVSKIATTGYHDILDHMISYLDAATSKDMIWQRISCALINHLSPFAVDIFVERILLTTKPSLTSCSSTCRILGNCLQTHARVPYTMCHKSLLVKCYPKPWLLYNIAGYLQSSVPGKQLMQKTLVNLLTVWSDVSLVRHLDSANLFHISRAIVLFTNCLANDETLSSQTCSDMFHQLMQGMKHHMSNPVIDQRLVAMRLAECVSKKIVKDGNPLKFDMNENDETILLTAMSMSMSEQEKQLRSNPDSLTHDDMTLSTDHVTSPADNVTSPTDHVTQSHDLSSDDDDEDLIAFSVTPNACNVPHYLREAMSDILEASPIDRLNLIEALPNLISSQPHDLDEVCSELCKILLHWGCSTEECKQSTKKALICLLCNCPVQAATYLTKQFCCHGYSIDQRLFILELLSLSSQQLCNSRDTNGANEFSPVAGHFFFPLLKYFEQKEKDELIVAHVIHTLAHVIRYASIATISSKMNGHLLELLLEYRSHPNASIRQSTLCGIAIILSTSSPLNCPVSLKQWLEDVISNDSDYCCRSLATEAIKLL